MGFFQDIGRTLGLTKSKAQGQAPARQQRTTPLETDEGKLLSKTLKDRISGLGVGLSKNLTDAASATFAKRQRGAFKETTAPALSASASARGLGRSTIPLNREALERQKVEESISERVANLGLASEQLASQEKQNAISQFQALALTDVNAKNAEVAASNAFNNAEFLRQQGFRERADAEQQKALAILRDAAIGAATGGMGLLPGTVSGGTGALQGALAGVSGDFGLFKKSAPLFGGGLVLPSGAKPGEAATVNKDTIIGNIVRDFGISKERAEQIYQEESAKL